MHADIFTEMASNEAEEDDGNWEQLIRRMLPAGAPLPDEDHADYSIAVEYQGPPPAFDVPKVHCVDIDLIPARTPSIVMSSDPDPYIPVVLPVTMKPPRLNRGTNRSFAHGSTGSTGNYMSSMDQTDRPNHEFQDPDHDEVFVGSQTHTPRSSPRSEELASPGNHVSGSSPKREELASPGNHVSRSSPNPPDQNLVDGRREAAITFNETTTVFDNGDVGSSSPQSTVSDAVGSPRLSSSEEKRLSKRGMCSRCGRGNRFTDREVCLVCGALFCSDCILKAMGSMPEGRKCVGCIGKPIDESRRSAMGKRSRILWKVCSPLEVKHIMKAEMECSSNQLRPEQLVVNGRQLRNEELLEIFGCPLPPQKLKPGKYWYDKDSGLWGKEGGKPDQMISSKLNVGGKLRLDASSGNTKVYINGREITKTELRVLKLAKVQCPRDTHFWVYDDGSYEEEGQNNIKGNIWGKASTRFISSLFSLPTPSNAHGKKEPKIYSGRTVPEYLDHGKIHKLLLLGLESSGTSTVFKQAKFLYGNKFTQQEVQSIKHSIQSNLYKHLSILLEGRERFEEEALASDNSFTYGIDASTSEGCETKASVYSINQRFKHFSDWLLNIMATGDLHTFFPAATREYAPVVDELWKDPAIQETYKRRGELRLLLDDAKYFLDRVIEISSNDYEPSEKDILYAEGMGQSNGVTSSDFSFDDRSPMSELYNDDAEPLMPLTRYQLIRVGSKGLREGCKWLEMFEEVGAVIFCVALSDYDQVWGGGRNKMAASRDLFERVARHPSFGEAPFVLLLNKYDVFEEKIGRVALSECDWFWDFSPVRAHQSNQVMAQQAYFYVAMKFKEMYGAAAAAAGRRKLFVWQTNARDRPSVDEAFKYVREVLKWNEDKDDNLYGVSPVDDSSFYSIDTTVSPFIRHE